MRKLIPYAVLIVFFVSCSSEPTAEELKEEIQKKKEQVLALNSEIEKLEKQLVQIDSTKSNKALTLVKINNMEYTKFVHYFEANGSVEAVNAAFISPEINGQIEKIHVEKGDKVTKNQLLVSLNDETIRNSMDEVETQLDLAKTLYEKQKKLWQKKIGSEVQYLEMKNRKESLEKRLETLEVQLDMTKIKAPFSGIVDEIFLKEGELAVPGVQLIQLINLKKVFVNADISENYLSDLKVGDEVDISFPAYNNYNVKAKIQRIGNVINSANRTFPIQIELTNQSNKLKPNIMAVVKISDFETDSALLVPSIIVQQDTKGEYIYVIDNENNTKTAKKQYITTGMSSESMTMITEGLNAGDKVITDGYNLVTDKMEVHVENSNQMSSNM